MHRNNRSKFNPNVCHFLTISSFFLTRIHRFATLIEGIETLVPSQKREALFHPQLHNLPLLKRPTFITSMLHKLWSNFRASTETASASYWAWTCEFQQNWMARKFHPRWRKTWRSREFDTIVCLHPGGEKKDTWDRAGTDTQINASKFMFWLICIHKLIYRNKSLCGANFLEGCGWFMRGVGVSIFGGKIQLLPANMKKTVEWDKFGNIFRG